MNNKKITGKKIVLITTDTQRRDMCNCYAETGLKTPCIDNLAKNGIKFDKAYTTNPVCQPARAGIFTGQYPHSCASWANSMGISDNTITIGKRLQDNGIHTAYIGKWHLDGSDYFGTGKCPDGWDDHYWYDMRNYLDELTEEERRISRNTAYMRDKEFPLELTYGHRCADKAIDFLKKHSNKDFFLSLSFDEPHGPFMCPEPYSSMYKNYTFPKSLNYYDNLENKPVHQRVWAGETLHKNKENHSISNPYYFGCNSFIDSEIGRVTDTITRLIPDAIIIYTSDHGDFLGSHSLSGKGPAAYDEITRIPFIITGKNIQPGIVNNNPVSHINIAPTIMELMGMDVPKIMEGKSLANELLNSGHRTNEQIFIEFGRYEVDHDGFGGFQPMRCVFDGRYKLTINLLSTDELYDLEKDPSESINLINDGNYKDIRNKLHDILLEHQNETRDPFRGYYWERRSWRDDAASPTWDYTGMTRQREEDEKYERRQLDYSTGLNMENAVRKK